MNAENMYDAWDNGDRHEIRQQFANREAVSTAKRTEHVATTCAKLVDLESSLLGRELQSAAAIRARGD